MSEELACDSGLEVPEVPDTDGGDFEALGELPDDGLYEPPGGEYPLDESGAAHVKTAV